MPIPNLEDQALNEPDVTRFRVAYKQLKTGNSDAIRQLVELADEGSILSLVHLGDAYRTGDLVRRDISKSEEYYKRAARAGSLLAYYYLGRILLMQKKYDEAMRFLNYASGKGYGPATHFLGRVYLSGKAVTADIGRGEKLLRRAAKQGSVAATLILSTSMLRNDRTFKRIVTGIALRCIGVAEALFFLIVEGRSSDRLR